MNKIVKFLWSIGMPPKVVPGKLTEDGYETMSGYLYFGDDGGIIYDRTNGLYRGTRTVRNILVLERIFLPEVVDDLLNIVPIDQVKITSSEMRVFNSRIEYFEYMNPFALGVAVERAKRGISSISYDVGTWFKVKRVGKFEYHIWNSGEVSKFYRGIPIFDDENIEIIHYKNGENAYEVVLDKKFHTGFVYAIFGPGIRGIFDDVPLNEIDSILSHIRPGWVLNAITDAIYYSKYVGPYRVLLSIDSETGEKRTTIFAYNDEKLFSRKGEVNIRNWRDVAKLVG